MNNNNLRLDRRVNRTRRQLRDAMMSLVLERGYNAVTIEDITERADLGRTTFYLHYQSKYDLLVESLEEIAQDLKVQVEHQAYTEKNQGIQTNPVTVVFQHVEENRDLYRILLKGEGSITSSKVHDIMTEGVRDFLKQHVEGNKNKPPEIPLDVVAGYFASAMMGFIAWWLDKDLPYTGEGASDLFMKLFFRGANQVLNLQIEE